MTEEQANLLSALKEKIETLKAQYSEINRDYKALQEENSKAMIELAELKNKHLELVHNFEMLKISRAFSGSDEEKKGLKKKIGLMVRDIDKCIELLNE